MIKPDYLPFRSLDFSPEQALRAGMFVLSQDVAQPGLVNVYQELTGMDKIVGDARAVEQRRIISEVSRQLNLHIGINQKVNPIAVVQQFELDTLLS